MLSSKDQNEICFALAIFLMIRGKEVFGSTNTRYRKIQKCRRFKGVETKTKK
jgi:hypothetical protein